jgi:hypothetical protein
VSVFSLEDGGQGMALGPGPASSPLEVRDLDPQDYGDHAELMRQNRANLDWELALLEQLPGDSAAPYLRLD